MDPKDKSVDDDDVQILTEAPETSKEKRPETNKRKELETPRELE